MVAVAIGTVLLYAVFTGVTGIRVLMLAARTRQLPESLLGCSYLIGGMLGWSLLLVSGALLVGRSELHLVMNILQGAGSFCLNFGIMTTSLFAWRVFSPRSRLIAVGFFAQQAVLLADFVHNGLLMHLAIPPATDPWFYPGMFARDLTYVWLPIVALRYWNMLRKRLPLGLSDPVATNRVLLWGLTGVVTFAYCVVAGITAYLDLWITHGEALFLCTGVMNSVGALLGWLAFVPPASYVRWVEARAPKVLD